MEPTEATIETQEPEQTTPPTEGEGAANTEENAPASEEILLKFPDGLAVDEAMQSKFMEHVKKHGMTSELAQETADLYIQGLQEAERKAEEAWEQTRADWKKTFETDREFGGSRLDDSKTYISKAMKVWGDDQFAKWLDDTGLGDHPEVCRFLARAGSALKEGQLHFSDASPQRKRSLAERLNPPA